jgi:site-specific recombinase XerD
MLVEVEGFIDWVRMRSPQARTWRDYKCDLSLFTIIVANRVIEEIRPRDIDDFVNLQVSKGYRPSTVNRRLAAVTSFFTYLNTKGRQLTCPVLPKRHYLREPQRLPRPINEQDLKKYFRSVDDVRDRAMFTLMLRCGLRIGEVSDLKIPDLYLGECPSWMIIRGKGAKERTVFLSPEAEGNLQNWLTQRPKVRDQHVFISYQHKKLSTTSISIRINYVRRLSGVELTAHRLRHTFADHLLSAGMPITSIQKLMGHRFVETTQNYALANDRQVQEDFYKASQKLDGWKLLVETVQSCEPVMTTSEKMDDAEVPIPVKIIIPNHILLLPGELIQQLEAYRQLKVNRWRTERVAANSILFYSQHGIIWRFFCDTCGVKTASELCLDHVLQFVKARLDTGRSARTINGSLSSLCSFLSFLKEDDVSIHASLDNIQHLKETELLPRYITSEQVLRLKMAIEGEITRAKNSDKKFDALLLRAVFYLLWQSGLRSGEVEMLRVSDFYISKSNETKRLFVRDGKWRKGRAIYLTDVALHALRAYLAVRGTEPLGGFVFLRNGLPLKKNFLSQRLKGIGKQVNISVSPHRLRHTFATQLLNVGCKVTSIQKLLGHTNLNTTMTHARAFDQTVMLDYFRAIDTVEVQPEGAWHDINHVPVHKE